MYGPYRKMDDACDLNCNDSPSYFKEENKNTLLKPEGVKVLFVCLFALHSTNQTIASCREQT